MVVHHSVSTSAACCEKRSSATLHFVSWCQLDESARGQAVSSARPSTYQVDSLSHCPRAAVAQMGFVVGGVVDVGVVVLLECAYA